VIGLALCFFLIVGFILLSSGKSASQESLLSISEITEQDHLKGSKEAAVSIIEYSDLQCPACAYYSGFSKQLEKDFGDSVVFVYRHFPLITIHLNSISAAMSAEAAGKQGKFWEMHDLLFASQQSWSKSDKVEPIFEGYALEIGLDINKYRDDVKSVEVASKIQGDMLKGNLAGVKATPTFMINGKKITNPKNYEAFKALISQEVSR